MTSMPPIPTTFAPVSAALERIQTEVLEGLQHGFFSLKIECEIINGKKRRVIVEAGKKYQFVIPEEDVAE